MKQGLLHLQWRPCSSISLASLSLSSSFPSSIQTLSNSRCIGPISAALNSSLKEEEEKELANLPARERRKLRNERREKNAFNWREEVEMRLIKKPKKRYASWTEELNLDNLAHLGPQWWVVRVSRVSGQNTAELLARSLANNFPHIDFKVYIPAVEVKIRLKSGSYSIKSKPLFPGCVFLRCVLNKEIHDFIRDYDGIGGFVGSKVGNTKRQINKPRPVSEDDMEAIFQQAKEEQEKADQAFQDEYKGALDIESLTLNPQTGDMDIHIDTKPRGRLSKASQPASKERNNKLPKKGSTIRVVSGAFAEFSGTLKKLDRKNGKATVGFTLFGKETIADVDINDIVEKEE